METDLVLGVAIAPTALGLVLVRGRHAEGQILDRDLIETPAAAERAKSAILQTYSTAVKHGYRIRAVDVTHVGIDAAVAAELVTTLHRLGMRNVVVIDPTVTESAAARYAVDMVGESQTLSIGGRHRHAAPRTSKRLALGAAATGVLTVLAATVVVNATSDEPAPPAAPTSSVVPAPAVPAAARTTPRSVFTGSPAKPRATPVSALPPSPAMVETPSAPTVEPSADPVAIEPPTEPSEHLPSTEGEPRLPGPA